LAKKGRRQDKFLIILIYALVYDLIYFTNKQHYKLVGDFLESHEIIHKHCAEDIRKRFKNSSFEKIAEVWALLGAINDNAKKFTEEITRDMTKIEFGFQLAAVLYLNGILDDKVSSPKKPYNAWRKRLDKFSPEEKSRIESFLYNLELASQKRK
jgi:hypothetical protein